MSDELAAAFRRTEVLGNEKIDRRNWTTNQWADDAERIMSHIDGASSALLNGHIAALIRTIRNLRESTKHRTITTVEELDALPTNSVVLSDGRVVWEKLTAAGLWARPSQDMAGNANYIALPATVLHEPAAGGAS